MYDIQKIREDFPILGREVYGKPLIYLDNGATTQKPRCVVEAITDEYYSCLLYTSPSPRDGLLSRMPSSA